ncbi:uncharacterized protein LOC124398628 [Silurus meridionalis]|nr:uncharacterized protein LOC124398628 [Silurus meridionalis]
MSSATVTLKVYNKTQCGVPKIMSAYLGQNITINCNYPEEYERNTKNLIRLNDDSFIQDVLDTNTNFQNGRFSISDNTSAKVFSVNISNVEENDEAFYLFGVWNQDVGVSYWTIFAQMWLQVTATSESSLVALEAPPKPALCFSSPLFITVCVCGALLLIGGFALMISKLRYKKIQDDTPSYKNTDNRPVTSDRNTDSVQFYENFNLSTVCTNTPTIS